MRSFNLNTTATLPPVGKECMCFHIDGKSFQTAKGVKSMLINKVVGCVLYIDTFEQHCVLLKCMLQSPRIKDHMKTLSIDQSLSQSALF